MSEIDLAALHPAIEPYLHLGRSGLLPALHAAQKVYGWLSEPVAEEIANSLNIPLVDVHGVIEFYTLFYNEPVGRRIIRVCVDPACALKDGDAVLRHLCNHHGLEPGQTAADGSLHFVTVDDLDSKPWLGDDRPSTFAALRDAFDTSVALRETAGLTFVVALALMWSIHPWLTGVALIPLPFVTLAVKYFGSAIHTRFEKIQEQLSDVSAVTQESLAGVRVVRAHNQEPFELERFRRSNQEYLQRNRALIRLQGMYFPSMGLLMGIGALLVLWIGSREVIAGRMTVGALVAFNAYLMMLGWPMIAFGWVTNLLQRGMASWKRMLAVLDASPLKPYRSRSGFDKPFQYP